MLRRRRISTKGRKIPFGNKVAALSPYVWWKLNETSGTTITNYGSGGATFNATWTVGGGALGVAGIGDGLTAVRMNATSLIANGAFTAPSAAVMDTGTLMFWWKLSTAQWNDGVNHGTRLDRGDSRNYIRLSKTTGAGLGLQRVGSAIPGTSYVLAPTKSEDWFILALTWNQAANQSNAYQILKGGTVAVSASGVSGGAWEVGTALWQIGYSGATSLGDYAHWILFPSVLTQAQLQDLARV